MPIKFSSAVLITLLISIISCKDAPKDDIAYLQTLNDSIKKVFAPDKRVAIYNITLSAEEDQIKITGEADQLKSVTTLIDLFKSKGITVENLVNILPDSSVGQRHVSERVQFQYQQWLIATQYQSDARCKYHPHYRYQRLR